MGILAAYQHSRRRFACTAKGITDALVEVVIPANPLGELLLLLEPQEALAQPRFAPIIFPRLSFNNPGIEKSL